MIPLKEIRLKGINSASLGGPGVTTVNQKDAEMYFDPGNQIVFARRLRNGEQFIVPVADVAYMRPLEPLTGIFSEVATLVTTVPGYTAQMSMPLAPPVDDVVRMVKIDGKVEERRGEPKDDELEALTKPERKIFKK